VAPGGYERIFAEVNRSYSCINAATMWLVASDETRAQALARSALEVVATERNESPDACWLDATEAEAR
jgi:hypothetical protein